MNPKDLTFIGDNPGAVKHGNFINYYSFHSTKQRTNNLHPQMFPEFVAEKTLICLDIGCNSGELTKDLHSYLKSRIYPEHDIHMLAIDIDPVLVKRAQELNSCSDITFCETNVMDKNDQSTIRKYLSTYQRKRFDITFCFSVTMWIHLNNGDEGLREFLTLIKDISKTIIIEPQPWNCYRSAQRRIKKSGSDFPLYKTLKIRSDVDGTIESTLKENSHVKMYESPSSEWKRKIQSFQITTDNEI